MCTEHEHPWTASLLHSRPLLERRPSPGRLASTRRALAGTLIALAAASFAPAADATPFELSHTFDDPDLTPPSFDSFALAVALDGNRVLVGDRRHRTSGNEVGQAYLFDAATGGLVTTFDDPTPTGTARFQGDNFGASVAFDGSNVVIGAPYDRTGRLNRGQAHLFDAATGDRLRTFDDPTPTDRDTFGNAVALDGGRVLIGARRDDTRGTDVGQAHLFDAATGDLLMTFDDPTPTGADLFGQAVALDGGRVLIGAYWDDTSGTDVGQAHLFDAATGDLLATFDDPTPTGADQFGQAVALDGGFVVVGAPGDDTNGTDVGQVHLFDATTAALLGTFDDPTPAGLDLFGVSVALDGGHLLIGAPFEQDGGPSVNGQAHLFDVTSGALLATFDDPTPTSGDQFGLAVALDGGSVLVGAPHDQTSGLETGQAHLFTAVTAKVPEPSALGVLLAGLAALGALGRRRQGPRAPLQGHAYATKNGGATCSVRTVRAGDDRL